MILTLTGPSGVGKTTLLNNLLRALPKAQFLESVTTRKPRPTDENFKYVTDEEFERMKESGEFLWTAYPHGKKYGTRKAAVDEALASEAFHIPVLVIESVAKLHAYAPGKIISFYIYINSEEELRRRFKERGDMSEGEIESRIAECKSWDDMAKDSGVPFIYIDGQKSREEMLAEVLSHLRR